MYVVMLQLQQLNSHHTPNFNFNYITLKCGLLGFI